MSKSGWIRSLAVVDPECSYHNQMYVHEMEKSITYTIIHNPSNYSYNYEGNGYRYYGNDHFFVEIRI